MPEKFMKNKEKQEKKQGFFANLLEKLDKRLEEKSKKAGCCCQPKEGKKDSCCG